MEGFVSGEAANAKAFADGLKALQGARATPIYFLACTPAQAVSAELARMTSAARAAEYGMSLSLSDAVDTQ